MAPSITWTFLGYIFITCCWSAFAEITIETKTICENEERTPQLRIFCPSGTQMWINRAYNGRAPWDQDPKFCHHPSPNHDKDCFKNEIVRTTELFKRCYKASTCTIYLTNYYSLDSCNEPGEPDEYTGTPYLAVEYTCYTKNDEQGDFIPQVNIETDFERETNDRVLIQSDGYQRGEYRTRARGACSVTMPPQSYLLVHVMDFRAHFLSDVGPCAAELVLHDGEQWETICGGLTWSYHNYTLQHSNITEEGRLDIALRTLGDNSQARLEIIIEGKKNSGEYVQNMRIDCGRDHETYTTTTTTTTTTTEAPTTTTKAELTTTTAVPTTTTTTIPDPTTTIIISPTTTTADPTGTTRAPSGPQTGGDLPYVPDTPTTTSTTGPSTGNGTNVTGQPGSSKDNIMSKIILGAALGGAVVLAALLVGTVCCCTRRSRERALRQRQMKMIGNGNAPIMAFGSTAGPSDTRPKKQNNAAMNRQRNPYTMNNQRHGSDEFYSEIEDGRSSIKPGWSTDNRAYSPPPGKHNHARNLAGQYDPAFDQPTESTLKMAQGTTRGFTY